MRISAGTSRRATATFCALVAITAAGVAAKGPAAARAKNCHATKTCPPATTTQPASSSTVAPTTTTQPPTTTTTIGGNPDANALYAGAFLSYPHQSGRQTFSGSNLVISNRSYVGFTAGACLTISNAVSPYIHDIDFDGCGGGLFLINVTGTIRVENIRCRNTGNGNIGSGQGNCIQFNNVWQGALDLPSGGARIVHVKSYGGDTEDVISIFRSGGVDALHPLVIGDVHVEHPLTGSLAWSSGSGTCANLADDGGHDIRLQYSTFLNCGAVGIQMNEPAARVVAKSLIVYGAQRPTSNVGLSQWSDVSCPSSCPGNSYLNNRVWWKTSSGSNNPFWLSGNYPVADVNNVKQDATINPASLKVTL